MIILLQLDPECIFQAFGSKVKLNVSLKCCSTVIAFSKWDLEQARSPFMPAFYIKQYGLAGKKIA